MCLYVIVVLIENIMIYVKITFSNVFTPNISVENYSSIL